jgi:hypothetical protein
MNLPFLAEPRCPSQPPRALGSSPSHAVTPRTIAIHWPWNSSVSILRVEPATLSSRWEEMPHRAAPDEVSCISSAPPPTTSLPGARPNPIGVDRRQYSWGVLGDEHSRALGQNPHVVLRLPWSPGVPWQVHGGQVPTPPEDRPCSQQPFSSCSYLNSPVSTAPRFASSLSVGTSWCLSQRHCHCLRHRSMQRIEVNARELSAQQVSGPRRLDRRVGVQTWYTRDRAAFISVRLASTREGIARTRQWSSKHDLRDSSTLSPC